MNKNFWVSPKRVEFASWLDKELSEYLQLDLILTDIGDDGKEREELEQSFCLALC